MSVWFCIPSARPPAEVEPVLAKWQERGYNIALFCDSVADLQAKEPAHASYGDNKPHPATFNGLWGEYPGYAEAVNRLAELVLQCDPSCDWIVTGGDDTLPDPNHTAEEIAAQCSMHFGELHAGEDAAPGVDISVKSIRAALNGVANYTFGVMQPTGDRFAGGSIDRIAGSPWLGRSFCERVNGGRGPLWPEYTHMFSDEELQNVATKLGVFWQRPDLIHLHRHFMRESDAIDSDAVVKPVPAHLAAANTPEHWAHFKKLFENRKAAGFPCHEPI